MFTPEMKRATITVVHDDESKMSYRIFSFLYYLVIRAAEIIDWWFPTEYEKLQRKRAKACLNDSAPKGATIEVDPKTGEALPEKTD